MEIDSSIKCINCGDEIRGNYCQTCSQPAKPEKLTFLALWSDYFGRVFNLDTKFLRTVRDLTLRPGKVSLDFVEGNRVRYVPPVSYFIILITLLILFLAAINLDYSEVIASTQQAFDSGVVNDKEIKLRQKFNEIFVQNMRTFFFLQIPFVAMWGRIIFKKSGYNFLENSVLALYTHGHLIWLGILGALIFKLSGEAFNGINALLSAVYFSWACAAFYKVSNPKAFFKGLAVHALMMITFTLLIIIIIIVGFFIYVKFINPQFLDTL